MTVHGAAVTQLLMEFLTLDTFAESIAELMDMPDPPQEPVRVSRLDNAGWIRRAERRATART